MGPPSPVTRWGRSRLPVIDASGTEHLIDRAAARTMPEQHRTGSHDYSRQLWTLLVFMQWHSIVVEQRITTEMPAPLPGLPVARHAEGA